MDDAVTLAARLGVPTSVVAEAFARTATGTQLLLTMSGKLASGKDTLSSMALAQLGKSDTIKLEYADALKDEADQVLAITADKPGPDGVAAISELQGISPEQSAVVHAMALASIVEHRDLHARGLVADPIAHSRGRWESARTLLQYYGTEVRRAQDPDYWVKRTIGSAVALIADGHDVFITDARFPNEVSWAQAAGFFVIRVEVDDATQTARLLARGDAGKQLEARNHHSETALDGYTGFDLVVDNNGTLEDSVAIVVSSLRERFGHLSEEVEVAKARPRRRTVAGRSVTDAVNLAADPQASRWTSNPWTR